MIVLYLIRLLSVLSLFYASFLQNILKRCFYNIFCCFFVSFLCNLNKSLYLCLSFWWYCSLLYFLHFELQLNNLWNFIVLRHRGRIISGEITRNCLSICVSWLPVPICIWRHRVQVGISRPRSSIYVCLIFVLQLKFVLVTVSPCINSAATFIY